MARNCFRIVVDGMGQDDRVSLCMRQIKRTADCVAKLVMQSHSDLTQDSSAGPCAALRVCAGSEIAGRVQNTGQGIGEGLEPFTRDRARLDNWKTTHIRNNRGMSLSGGERRRVEIARALATDPDFILLDEPFAGVDPISVNDIKQIISHLQARGIGILITDHNVRETLDICEKAYIVGEGHIIAAGSADDILADEQVRSVYLGHEFQL